MSEWQHKSKSYGWWHALRPSTMAFRRKWYGAELGTSICTKMTWLEGMLPNQFSPLAERVAALTRRMEKEAVLKLFD
jgi:hypothetical protein